MVASSRDWNSGRHVLEADVYGNLGHVECGKRHFYVCCLDVYIFINGASISVLVL